MIYRLLFIVTFIVIISGCDSKENVNIENPTQDSPTREELEDYIREKFDGKGIYEMSKYEDLLKEISKEKYAVLPINEFRKHFDSSKVVIGMRHDIDHHPFKALEFAALEQSYGIRSTYYVLATGEYYGVFNDTGVVRYDCMNDVYKELYDAGHEIGVHNDLLSIMVLKNLDPFQFNKNELDFYKQLEIPIYGTVAHGSELARELNISNHQFFSDFARVPGFEYNGKEYKLGQYSLSECGYEYDADYVDFDNLYHDSGGNWNIGSYEKFMEAIKSSKEGDRIEILIHPTWWKD